MTAVSPRGLATVALLKTRFDEGKDHLGLFEPFIEDVLRHSTSNNFIASDIRGMVESRHGLSIATNAVQAILGRFVRAGYLERAGGRFIRTPAAITGPDIEHRLREIIAQQEQLAEAFVHFAQEHSVPLTGADALLTLAAFISDNKVPLLLDEAVADSPHKGGSLPLRMARLAARFLATRCVTVPTLRTAVEGLLEGLVLRDTLLLADLADVAARFRSLTVVIDTPILLAALDLAGVANGIAAREFVSLLRDTGATTIAFGCTLDEIRSILSLYEDKLATAHGRLALYPNEVTQHVLASKLTPADMRTTSALLERSIAQLGIGIRDTPRRNRDYTLDEAALANALVFPYDPDPQRPRIRHDVECVAAVLTIRAGRMAPTIERSWAVFCSSSTQVVRNVQRWYQAQGEGGVPPIVHQVALSSIAWLKKPASARGLKLHELTAHCAAVLRPRKETWDKFVSTLRGLRDKGQLNDDETVAIVANDLAEPLLAQLDDDHEPTADTILDAIERVRRSYRDEAERTAAAAIQRAQADAAVAQQSASAAVRDKSLLVTALDARANRVAALLASAVYYVILAALVGAVVLSIPGVFEAIGPGKNLARLLLAVAGVLGIVAWRRGESLNDYRQAVSRVAARWVRARIFGLDRGQSDAALPSDPK